MNKNKIGAVIIGGILALGVVGVFVCTERVPAGFVGVQYSMNGGVQDEVLSQGFHIVSPTKKVSLYSVATEQLYLSADNKEGSKDNDSFDVVTKDGTLNVDFEMSYRFETDKVSEVFTRYRGMSGEDIMNNIIRGKIKTYTNEVTSRFTVLEAHMEKKGELNKQLTEHLRVSLAPYGIGVESATLTRTKPSQEVEQAIVKRTTMAQELEAEKQRQEKAKVEQETKRIEAETKAMENKKIEQSLNDKMLTKMWIEKWDGKVSLVNGDGSMIIPSK